MPEPTRRRPRFWYLRRQPETMRSEIEEELAHHLAMRVAELASRGLSPDAARREALRQFGDLGQTRRYCERQDQMKETRMQRSLMLQDIGQDFRIGARTLRRSPLLAMTIVATVGLGIAATTAIFAAVRATLLRPLPYAEPDRLVRIYTDTPPFVFRFSVADYLALQEQQTTFERIAAYTELTATYSDGRGAAELLRGRRVTWTYFGLLGITPVIGSDFTEADGRPGSPPRVLVSEALWRRRLGARWDVVGTAIRLDGVDHVVAGVLPPAAGPLERGQEVFVAAQFQPPPRRGPFHYTVLGRVKAGVDRSVAAAELRAINRRIFPLWKSSYQDDRATWSMDDLKAAIVGWIKPVAGLSLAAVALVWLIACTNASNLLIARVTSRRPEIAVRTALGASRGRVLRVLLVESALLAVGSVAVGAVLGWGGTRVLRTVGATYFPRMQEIRLDGPVLGLMTALTLLSLLLFGLVPAFQGAGGSLQDSLRSLGRTATGTVAVRRLRRALVGAEFALATPLLVVAVLLLASLNELQRVDLGFDTRNLLTGSVRLPTAQYGEPGRVTSFWNELEQRLQAVPSVAGVAFADGRPPNGVGNINNFDLELAPTPAGQSQPATPWVAVSPGYFAVMGLERVEGRLLEQSDALRENLETVVVDRAWARRFFPNASAVGKRFREGGCTDCPWTTVVGVVSEVKYMGLDQPDEGTVYWPLAPNSLTRFVLLRAGADPATVRQGVEHTVRALEPAAPFTNAATIDELVADSLDRPKWLMRLVASFALISLTLSLVGIYGVMGYYVQQHLKEISIRLALGATPAGVLRLVVGKGMAVVTGGMALGLLGAVGVTHTMSSLLFGVSPLSPLAFAAVTLMLLASALLACLLPARLAVRLEPAAVLRQD